MPAYGLEPQVVMTTPLLEGTDGVEKMSKSLGNYIGVSDSAETIYARTLSISDALMWRYYALPHRRSAPRRCAAEQAKDAPMASKMALARRLVTDFHGAPPPRAAEAEWRRGPPSSGRRHRRWRSCNCPSGPTSSASSRRGRPGALAKRRRSASCANARLRRDGVVVDGGELSLARR